MLDPDSYTDSMNPDPHLWYQYGTKQPFMTFSDVVNYVKRS
jgi:hypothetical protein